MQIKFSIFLNFFDVILIFFRCFLSMFCLSMFCLFYVFAFQCFVLLCFVIDPYYIMYCVENLFFSHDFKVSVVPDIDLKKLFT